MVGFVFDDFGTDDGLSETAMVACEDESAASKAVGSLRRCWFSKMEKDEANGTSSSCRGDRSDGLDEQRTCSLSASYVAFGSVAVQQGSTDGRLSVRARKFFKGQTQFELTVGKSGDGSEDGSVHCVAIEADEADVEVEAPSCLGLFDTKLLSVKRIRAVE